MATEWPPRGSKAGTTGSVQDRGTCRAWLFGIQAAEHFLLLGVGPGEPLRATVTAERSEPQSRREEPGRAAERGEEGSLVAAEEPP